MLDVETRCEGGYIVSGSFDLDHLHDLVEFRKPEDAESTTVGGLVTEWLGRVPGSRRKRWNGTVSGSKCSRRMTCASIRFEFRKRSRRRQWRIKRKIHVGLRVAHRTPKCRKSTLAECARSVAKLAIVADKPQTTRHGRSGCLECAGRPDRLPGYAGDPRSDTLFNRRMMQEVRAALDERDLLSVPGRCDARCGRGRRQGHRYGPKASTPSFLVLTKIDLVQDKRNAASADREVSRELSVRRICPGFGRDRRRAWSCYGEV